MSISYEADGSVVLQSDIDPKRIETLRADVPREQRDVAITAFFAPDMEVPASATAADPTPNPAA